MLRVTLNSSCVQFASEIERTDVFLVKIIIICVLSFCFPACSPFLFPAYGKRRLNIIPAKCSPVSAFPILGYGKISKNTYFFSGAKVFNELPVNIASVNNIQAFCGLAEHLLL